MFAITNPSNGKTTNAGVLEFTADEGHVYLPDWLMKSLELNTRDFVSVENVSLSLGTFVKIQPQSADFLDISDHRAVLENALRNFSALTAGDMFTISYNDKLYDIKVLETKPSSGGISIVETDLQVDFEAPPGYVEPDYSSLQKNAQSSLSKPQSSQTSLHPSLSMAHNIEKLIHESRLKLIKESNTEGSSFKGIRLSGSVNSKKSYAVDLDKDYSEQLSSTEPVELDLPTGHLYFGYPAKKVSNSEPPESPTFSGTGQALRAPKKRK
ncbi:hypothetical protein BB560_005015 [Smittium megazygosporum]|uniref:Ubiquitin fusion degradation protein UFD1 n=1 Tax=Smittium megazygosporum TaxID=133381 RepID=A0A2T9Z7M4_9FUNG|nr:hypothetical protein BB560_007303 [Smittium megazygosporum]PVV00599.1 hypothetical protein BB560_005015 [Smittium megazygosporum]